MNLSYLEKYQKFIEFDFKFKFLISDKKYLYDDKYISLGR